MNQLSTIITSSSEWQGFGPNLLTISFLGTLFFTLLQAWGLFRQHQKIRLNKSAGSVSVELFSYSTASTLTFLLYGLSTHSFAIIFNGALLGFLFLVVLYDLKTFKKFNFRETLVASCSFLLIPIFLILPWKDAVLTFSMIISIIPLAFQPWEIWKNKSAKSVEPRFIIASMSSNVFWFAYGIGIKNWPLIIMSPIVFAISSITLFLTRRFAPKYNVIE